MHMNTLAFVQEYMRWHYDEGVKEVWEFWKNLLRFGYHFFSILLLLKTLFTPLYRIHDKYEWRMMSLEPILESLALNGMSRVLGFIMRMVLIVVGLVFEAIVLIIGPILFIVWITLPALSIIMVLTGFVLLVP